MLPLVGGGFWVALAQVSAVYYSAAIFLHYLLPALVPVRSVQTKPPKAGQVAREVAQSIGPLLVKAGVLTAVEKLHVHGYGLLYSRAPQSVGHVAWMVACVLLLDMLHDTWFYWTHRLLHWKPLYRHVHFMHHSSHSPTAFTGYSFHVVEAAIVFANEILVTFLFPIHAGLHRAYHLFTTIIHNGGHAGYEIAPFIPSLEALAALAACGWRRPVAALNTVQHHEWHHRFPNRHFSLYFTHWDRWCGTLHEEYDCAVEASFTAAGTQTTTVKALESKGSGVAGKADGRVHACTASLVQLVWRFASSPAKNG